MLNTSNIQPSKMTVKLRRVLAPVNRLIKMATLWTVISIGIIIFVAFFSPQERLLQFNRLIQDFFISNHVRTLHDDVIIVAIDNKSIETLGRWPWRRTFHAELLDRISTDHPKAIGLDVLFIEPDHMHPYDDAMLAASIKRNTPVVLPVFMQNQGTQNYVVTPLPAIANNAAQLGHAHIKMDEDGIVRSFYLLDKVSGASWNHFSVALVAAGKHSVGTTHFPVSEMTDALDERSSKNHKHPVLIPFAGSAGHFKQVSYVDVIRGAVPKGTFNNKYVLVGASAVGIADQYATPTSGKSSLMPGIEILANVTDGLLHNIFIQPASTAQNITLNLVFVIIAIIGFIVLSPTFALLVTIFLGIALIFTSYTAIDITGTLYSPAAGIIGLIFIYPLWSWHKLNTATRFLTVEFESFQQRESTLFTSAPPLVNDFLDRRIAALKGATKQLQILHRFVTDSVNNLPYPTLISGVDGKICIANLAAARHFGLPDPDDLLMQYIPTLILDIVSNDTRQPLITDEIITNSVLPVKSEAKDSQGRDLIVKCVPILNDDNRHTGWILSLIDISNMRQAERDREAAFRFITHDIRSPLSSIISLLELHHLQPEKNNFEVIERLKNYADSALALADNFVNLARAKSGEYHFEPLNLSDLVSETADEVWAIAQTRNITIKVTTGDLAAYAMADRNMFKRALTNLINNAIKFSPNNSHILCTISSNVNQWDIAITDHGVGIPSDKLETLFQPFNRLHSHSHPNIDGIGLGLSFVNTVVKRHKGKIFVKSKLNEGSTFHLLIPKAESFY